MRKYGKPTSGYDPACATLAEHFLQDEPRLKGRVAGLAAAIQQAVENWIAYEQNQLTPIFEALRANEISATDAIERILYHPSYGGNRDDAESLVEEWGVQIDQDEETAWLKRQGV